MVTDRETARAAADAFMLHRNGPGRREQAQEGRRISKAGR